MPWRKVLYRKWVSARHRLLGVPSTGHVGFGDLRRVEPFGRHFGTDRGEAIDRYYIEAFLAARAADIHGRVLEVGDDSYTRKFGGQRVTRTDVLHVDASNPRATIVADLANAPQIPDGGFDCIVLTQVLHLIYEPRSAVRTLYRILKPGGVLLLTTPGISQVPHGTMAGCHGCTYQYMGFYDVPGIGKGAQMCMEAWYGWFSGGSSEGYWEGNILSQKLGINNYELSGIMSWLLAVRYGIVDKKKLGLASIPMLDHAGKPQMGGQKVHHDFLSELLNGIASGRSILSKGTARAAESLGPAAQKFFNGIFPAWGYKQNHIENLGSALHWAMDTRDHYSSCHDYTYRQAGSGLQNAQI